MNSASLSRVLLGLVALVWFASLGAEPILRAHYEVKVTEEGNSWGVGTGTDVVSGQPVVHQLKTMEISLLPVIESSGEFDLGVSIRPLCEKPGCINTPFTQHFNGRLGIPLEFAANFGKTSIGGAIVIARVGG